MLSGKKFSTRSIYFGFGFYENDFMVAGDWSWFSIDIASLPILASLFIGSIETNAPRVFTTLLNV